MVKIAAVIAWYSLLYFPEELAYIARVGARAHKVQCTILKQYSETEKQARNCEYIFIYNLITLSYITFFSKLHLFYYHSLFLFFFIENIM